MSLRYRIGVAHMKQAEAARPGGFCAFSHGKESAVRKLAAGDQLVYSAPKTDFDGATHARGFNLYPLTPALGYGFSTQFVRNSSGRF